MSLESTYIKFEKLTGKDLKVFFNAFIDFVENGSFQSIYNYYVGRSNMPENAFTRLDGLINISTELEADFKNNKSSFNNLAAWDILDNLQESINRLQTIKNLRKYIKTSLVNSSNSFGIRNDEYILKQNQNLESVAESELKSNDSNNDWVDIAISNDIREEDYTKQGGNKLSIVYNNIGTVSNIEVVFDELVGEKVKGKDLDQHLTFILDDLKILDYQDTLEQAIDILIKLIKRDNPEFPNQGLIKMVGVSMASIGYPLLFRQLIDTFSTDDTVSDFRIVDIKTEQDAVMISVDIEAVSGETINKLISV